MQRNLASKFNGNPGDMFLINLGCFLLSLTIIGFPFAICIKQKWLMKYTTIVGINMEFNGRGIDLLGKMLIWLFFTIITFGIYLIALVPVRFREWMTMHTVFGPVERV